MLVRNNTARAVIGCSWTRRFWRESVLELSQHLHDRREERQHREVAGLVCDRPDRVAGQALVDHHAVDAHHRRAAVVALRVELKLLAANARLVLVADLRC